MRTLFLKLGLIILMNLVFSEIVKAQYASIQNTNMQFFGVLDTQRVASATTNYSVRLNKETGEFKYL